MYKFYKIVLLSLIVVLPSILSAFTLPEKKAPDEEGYYYTLKEMDMIASKARETDDYNLYSLVVNEDGKTIAHMLAFYTSWEIDDVKVLKLKDNENTTVAHMLANYNREWETHDNEILKLKEDKFGMTVAHYLAFRKPDWITYDNSILALRNKQDYTVAHYLARFNPVWTTKDETILELTAKRITVKDILKQNNKL